MLTDNINSQLRVDIWKKLQEIKNVPTLPAVYFKLEKLLADPNASIVTVRKAIEEDPPIVAKILQRVNNGYYYFSSEIRDIQHAIVMLGLKDVRNLVAELGMITLFENVKEKHYFNFDKFWRHSSGTAHIAQGLSRFSSTSLNNIAFSAGLLHDFGRLILCLYFEDLYGEVYQHSIDHDISLYDAERERIHFTHTEAGYWLAKHWHLPEAVADVMLHHHDVTPADVRERPLRAIVYLADAITNTWGFSLQPTPGLETLETDPVWQEMVRCYPRLKAFPLDNVTELLNLPPDDIDVHPDGIGADETQGVVPQSRIGEIAKGLANGISELAEQLNSRQVDLPVVLARVPELLEKHLSFDLLSLYRLDAETGGVSLEFYRGEPVRALDTINFRRGKGAVRWIFNNMRSLMISEYSMKSDSGVVQSLLGVPLIKGDELGGALILGSSRADAYTENEQYLLEVAGKHLGRLLRFT